MAKLWFPVLGILAIAWYLLRVIPKPSRALYPCQRVASGIGAGFLGYLVTLLFSCTSFWFLRKNLQKAVAVSFAVVLAVAVYVGPAVSIPAPDATQILTPKEGANNPIGTGKGIFPGRVVWDQDFAATSWDGTNGFWWEDKNINQGEVDKMFSKTLQSLTGEKSDRQAWDKLFKFYNQSNGRGTRGYSKGEKIVVKLNCNADSGKPWSNNKGYPAPHVVNALVRQLIENAGVPGDAIILSDPSRFVGEPTYNKIRSNPGPQYQRVMFEGQDPRQAPQRLQSAPDMDSPIYFDMPDGKRLVYYLPKSFADATYLINYAVLRPHNVFGVTLSAKNHFGSVYDPELKSFKPTKLHAFGLRGVPTSNHHGEAHCNTNLFGHKLTGGKTMLYFLDGLYTAYDQTANVVNWSSLNGRYFSSLLMSQDPVAIDSVAYDLITTEPNLTKGNSCFNGNVDSYLHESALADRPPSKAKYDPENDGTVLKSLGVHEHWNNAAAKKYSRNLGKKQGIELVSLN
jgi:hypothetical protein